MESARGDALEWALALAQAPGERHALRQRELPPGITELLQIATGNQGVALADASERSGLQFAELIEAARFYLREVLFFPDADAYRLLGLTRTADDAQIKQHHRLLQQWLHPDRPTSDWDATFASRVNAAWSQLRTPARRTEYDGQIPDAVVDERVDPSWSVPARMQQAAPVRMQPPPEPPRITEADRWRRRAPVLALFAVCGVLGLLAIRDMQREPAGSFGEQALVDEVLDNPATALEAQTETDPAVSSSTSVANKKPAAKPLTVAKSPPKPVAVAQVAKPIPKPQPLLKPVPRTVAAALPPKPPAKPVAVVAKPLPKPVAVAQVAKPIPKPQPLLKPVPRTVAAALPPKPPAKPVAVVAKPLPKPVAVAQVAKPIPKPQPLLKPVPRTVAAALPPKPPAKPVAVVAKPLPKPVAVAQVAKPIPKPQPLLKPVPRTVAAALPPKPPAKPVAVAKPAPKPQPLLKPVPRTVATAPPPKPSAKFAAAKPTSKAVPIAPPPEAVAKPATKPASTIPKASPAKTVETVAVSAPQPATVPSASSVPSPASASPQQLMQAQRIGQQLLAYVSSSKGTMPPIWDSAGAQAQATQARTSMQGGGRVHPGEPHWRIGESTASMTSDMQSPGEVIRRLRVGLVWRDQHWLVRSVTLDSNL